MGLVRRDTHILLKAVLALETGQLLVDLVGLELAGAPANLDARPAVAIGRNALPRPVLQGGGLLFGLVKHHVLEALGRAQGGDV